MAETAETTEPAEGGTEPHAARLFIPFGLLYALYGMVLGFVQGGIGPVLVARGLPLEYAGFVALLFLPIGLAFLWAPFMERRRIPGLPAQSGWIIACLLVAAALFVLLAFLQHLSPAALLVIGVIVTATLATMDLQLEGLVVRLVPDRQRPVAAALKIGLFGIGAVLGGGTLVAYFDALGWRAVFLAFAVSSLVPLTALTLLPPAAGPIVASEVSLRRLFRSGGFLPRLGASALFLASCFLLFGLNRIALVDQGASLQQVGWIVGTLGALAALPILAVSARAVGRFGAPNVLATFLTLGIFCGLSWSLSAAQGYIGLAITATIAGMMVLVGAYVVFLGALIKWSVSDMPATTYAVFYALANLAALVPMAGAGALAEGLGWSNYYTAATFVFIIAGIVFRHLLKT